jgi:hypothetical protein
MQTLTLDTMWRKTYLSKLNITYKISFYDSICEYQYAIVISIFESKHLMPDIEELGMEDIFDEY